MNSAHLTPSGLEFRDAASCDIDGIVATHIAAFPSFFLTRLGPSFLNQLYRSFREVPSGVCVVALSDGEVVGFVAGTLQPEGFFRKLLRSRWAGFLFSGLRSLLKHPLIVGARFLYAIRYRGESPEKLKGTGALLSSIAVKPQCVGRRVGSNLIDEFVSRAREAGCSYVFLTTDADENEKVTGLYERYGFQRESFMTRKDGRRLSRYVLLLDRSQGA
jgi:ribosomal protein S18 acetylase RimI-like enzyme